MPAARVGSRLLADRQTVMDVMPMLRRGVSRIDTERLDGINRLEDFLDFRPAGEAQEDFSAGAHIGDGRIAFARLRRAQDVDARADGAVVVRCPADEGEDAAWRERDAAPVTIDDLLFGNAAEPDPVLNALLEPQNVDMGEVGHAAPSGTVVSEFVERPHGASAAAHGHRGRARAAVENDPSTEPRPK